MSLLDHVRAAITRHDLIAQGARVVVGVSGGADSLVLLHVLCRLRDPLDLRLHVATLDHGIRGVVSAADAAFVRQTAAAWDVPATVGRTDVPAAAHVHGLGLEETARQVRYTFLVQVARQIGAPVVAVGHNRDDQAETVLMHLIRGSGLSGLRGMLPRTPLSAYHLLNAVEIVQDQPAPVSGDPAAPDVWPVLVRPLLDVSRADIDAYAAANDLQPRHDATNADTTYFRNRLRHDVISLLAALNPNIRETLARTADVLQADAALIQQVGEAALARLIRDSRADALILDRAVWATLSLAEKRYAIRAVTWRLRPALRDVTYVHVDDAIRVADEGAIGAAATLPGGLLLRVGHDTLMVGPADEVVFVLVPGEDAPALGDSPAGNTFRPGDRVQCAFGAWVFEAGPLPPDGDLDTIHADPLAAALIVPSGAWLQLRTRQPGDRFRPRGMGGHTRKLGDVLNSMQVPAAWRDRVPLLVVDGAIAWLVAPTADGVRGRVAEPFAVRAERVGSAGEIVVVRWTLHVQV